MTPRTVTFMMPLEATIADLLAKQENQTFSRVPLYDGSRDRVSGYILQNDVLRALANGGDRNAPLSKFKRDISFIPETASVGAALRQIVANAEHIAVVADEHGGIAGLVTLEDLTETVLGVEIVDESDQVVDLRKAAINLRDRRLERLRQKRQTPSE
jgi:CBS domain containing-hemolysin-like protein